MDTDAATAPLPDGGWSDEIVACKNALVIPPVTNGFRQAAGVLDADGVHCDHGATWRNGQALTFAPPAPDGDLAELNGRWMWAGLLFKHFGHFLIESSARLWALNHVDAPLDGLIYILKRRGQGEYLRKFQQQYFEAFGITCEIRIVTEPTRIEQLYVPGQAFGLGPIVAGTDRFRAAFHTRLGHDIEPDGPERLFVTRAGLGLSKGGIFGEDNLCGYLEADGYTVFYPEQHDIRTQIARYKAARQIIITDGSAAHFYAHLGLKNRQIAYLLRRSYWTDNILRHIESFCETKPLLLDTIEQEWAPGKEHHKAYRGVTFSRHSFARLQGRLREAGFIEGNALWPEITNDTVAATLRALELSDIVRPAG